jgi:hypothetical protein
VLLVLVGAHGVTFLINGTLSLALCSTKLADLPAGSRSMAGCGVPALARLMLGRTLSDLGLQVCR